MKNNFFYLFFQFPGFIFAKFSSSCFWFENEWMLWNHFSYSNCMKTQSVLWAGSEYSANTCFHSSLKHCRNVEFQADSHVSLKIYKPHLNTKLRQLTYWMCSLPCSLLPSSFHFRSPIQPSSWHKDLLAYS